MEGNGNTGGEHRPLMGRSVVRLMVNKGNYSNLQGKILPGEKEERSTRLSQR